MHDSGAGLGWPCTTEMGVVTPKVRGQTVKLKPRSDLVGRRGGWVEKEMVGLSPVVPALGSVGQWLQARHWHTGQAIGGS